MQATLFVRSRAGFEVITSISEFPTLPECYAVSVVEEPPTFRKMLTSVDLPILTA